MKKNKVQTLLLLTSFIFTANAVPTFALESANNKATCAVSESARDMLRQQLMDFRLSEFGIELQKRADAGDIILISSDVVSINAPITQADFGKSRDLAFSRAFLNTQSKFILLTAGQAQAEIVNERFDQEPSREQLSFSEGQSDGEFWQLAGKLYRLAEAKLNSALAEEGVPADELERLNPKKKVDRYKEELSRKTVRSAVGRVAGLLPIMNFETSDCNGRAAVATVAVFSQKTLDFAQAFINGKTFMPEPDSKADASIQQKILDEIKSDEIINIWGLRKGHDEEGYPALISYGQWSYLSHSGSARSNERREDTALIQAENNAIQQLALYLNGTATSKVETEIEEFVNDFIQLEQTQNGVIENTEVLDEIVERTMTRTAARATVTLKGISSPVQWIKPYPNDASAVLLTGAVVYWTPTLEDSVNKAMNSNQRRAGGESPEDSMGKEKEIKEADSRKSKVKNNARDF